MLQLVDLAGSEKAPSVNDAQLLLETQKINTGISALNLVVTQLAAKDQHVSYHNSRLTQLLEGTFRGVGGIIMICTITLDMGAEENTLSTLCFTKSAKSVDRSYAYKLTSLQGNSKKDSAASKVSNRIVAIVEQISTLKGELEIVRICECVSSQLTASL